MHIDTPFERISQDPGFKVLCMNACGERKCLGNVFVPKACAWLVLMVCVDACVTVVFMAPSLLYARMHLQRRLLWDISVALEVPQRCIRIAAVEEQGSTIAVHLVLQGFEFRTSRNSERGQIKEDRKMTKSV